MGGSPPRPALRAEEVRAGYGAGDIIHGVSVSVAPGTVASVVGPNGSGKSTLMKALTGVIRLSSGRVLVGDRDISGLAPEEVARAGVGYVPQIDDVFPPFTVRENLEMGGYLLPGRALAEAGAAVLVVEQRAKAVLAISDYTYVLGGGQVLMADTPARLSASQEFTESFFGAVPRARNYLRLRGTDRGWCRPGRRTPGSYDSGRRSRTDGPPQPAGCPSAAAASWPWRRVRPSRRHAASRRSTA